MKCICVIRLENLLLLITVINNNFNLNIYIYLIISSQYISYGYGCASSWYAIQRRIRRRSRKHKLARESITIFMCCKKQIFFFKKCKFHEKSKDLGTVTRDAEVAFKYAFRPSSEIDVSDMPSVPFQLQVSVL